MTHENGTERRLEGMTLANIPIAENPELLRKLKGAPMMVYMALAMYLNSDGVAWPSIKTLCETTGHGNSQVCAALNKLEELGLISRTKRQRSSTLYQIHPPTPAAGIRENEGNPQIPESGIPEHAGQSSNSQNGNSKPLKFPLAESKTARIPKTGQEEVVVVSNNDTDTILLPSVRQQEFENWDDWFEVEADLAIALESKKDAEKLVEVQRKKGRTPQWVKALLNYYRDSLNEGRLTSPLGWLKTALNGDVFNVPPKYLKSIQSLDPKRFIIGYEGIVEY